MLLADGVRSVCVMGFSWPGRWRDCTNRRSLVVGLAAGLVVAVGLTVLAGWMLGVAFLKSPFAGVVGMKADAAVGFVALGAGLGLTRSASTRWPRRAARALALLAGVIGALTLFEYLLERNLGIDQLLFRDVHSLHTVNPGRLAPQTAVVFVLLGIAVWMLNSARMAKSPLPRALVGTSFVIALFAIIGYGYGISGLTQVPSLTPIALYSALAFIILCVGVSAADPNGLIEQLVKSEASGAVAAKRLLPISVTVFPILGWLQIQGRAQALYSTETGVALLVLCSTVVLFVAVLSLTKRLSQLDVDRRIGIEREARLAALVDATNEAILSSDADGRITSWNRGAEELYGYTEPEMTGRSVAVLSPRAKAREQRDILQAVANGQKRTDIEIQSLHKDGSLLNTSVTISRIMQADLLIGFCGVSHDNTDQIRARDELERRVQERTRELSNARAETLKCLALAAEYRDDDTAQHTERVGLGAARLAEHLALDPTVIALIAQAAPLHDVGKIAIPDKLLLKPGGLTPREFDVMKRHTTLGARLLAGSSSKILQLGERIALTHHERWDGSGYPAGLLGAAIPIAGRIVAVVDAFDAMTNNRPYRSARTTDEALKEISRCSGSHFDPHVADAFLQLHSHLTNHTPPQREHVAPRSEIPTQPGTRRSLYVSSGPQVSLPQDGRRAVDDDDFRAIFDRSLDPMLLADDDAQYVDANPAACTFLGLKREELLALRVIDLAPDEARAEFNAIWKLFLLEGEQRGEYDLQLPDGRVCEIEFSATANVTPGQHLSILRDISERKRSEAKRDRLIATANKQARTDPLTGLPNRRVWYERITAEFHRARRANEPLTIAVIDLDGLKMLNDTQGHLAGDKLLQTIATAWQGHLRDVDLLARVGGDEFWLLFPSCPSDLGRVAIQRMRAATLPGQTFSAGTATWDGTESAESLIERADRSLYQEKLTHRLIKPPSRRFPPAS